MSNIRMDLSTADKRRVFLEIVVGMVMAGKTPVVEFVDDESARSKAQNSALHLFCEMVATTLNDAGLDMRAVMKQDVDIPWTKAGVKENLWRPVQEAMTGETSTTKPSKTQYPDISETLRRHIAQKFGVTLPAWPSRHGEEL